MGSTFCSLKFHHREERWTSFDLALLLPLLPHNNTHPLLPFLTFISEWRGTTQMRQSHFEQAVQKGLERLQPSATSLLECFSSSACVALANVIETQSNLENSLNNNTRWSDHFFFYYFSRKPLRPSPHRLKCTTHPGIFTALPD